MIEMNNAMPVLRMFPEDAARAFYIDYLDFTIDWEHRFEPGLPLYMQVRRGALVLHLSEHTGDAAPGAVTFIPMHGIDAFRDALLAKKASYVVPEMVREGWGKVLYLTDPSGNHLRFCEQMHD
jgi:predicted enzyme related to lactoylglutathione lyase